MSIPLRRVQNFHLLRLLVWAVQIPVAILTPLKSSVSYLVFLSIAALVESALTDYLQARQAVAEDPLASM